ncbi:TROVE domain-containing protein [Herbidospora daliensis]|uniref:TROVE domain-containing protein n=1 Tax=Herbidospora daliensis TaxID=295585 RepID=UPI00078591E2|nr:TROVE domain-containing protein [Herbidospora daliensis]
MNDIRDPLADVSEIGAKKVENAAGGVVFEKDLWQRVEDFLILGTTGGTYYVDGGKLTEINVGVLYKALHTDGPRVVEMLTEISTSRPPRAPKNQPALFALAAAYARGDEATRRAAKSALPKVARTTDHLATFFGYYKNLGGKRTSRGTSPVMGRSLRTALGSWFLQGEPDDVAFKVCKAGQRKTPSGESFALRDVLRMAHPAGDSEQRKVLFGWIAGNVGDDAARAVLPSVDRFLTAKAVTTVEEATRLDVPWEFLPDAMLTEPKVWDHLVDTIGLTALLRNLARMTRIGTLVPLGDATRRAAARLTAFHQLRKARVHPLDVWLAMRVYASGQGRGGTTWTPVPAILDALEEAYEKSFGVVKPTGKKLLLAVDSSGSMTYARCVVGGSPIGTPYEVGSAMAVMLARIEKGNVHAIEVDTAVHRSKVSARTNLRDIATWRASGGGTDLSMPFRHLLRERMNVDGVVVFTDNETWAGRGEPADQFDRYRKTVNPQTRLVVAAMTAAGYSIADHTDPNSLNVVGLDASLPMIVNGFVR